MIFDRPNNLDFFKSLTKLSPIFVTQLSLGCKTDILNSLKPRYKVNCFKQSIDTRNIPTD